MESTSELTGQQPFSLLGGPLHRLGARLGLVRGGNNTVALGLAIGSALWIAQVAQTLVHGLNPLSFEAIGAHVRLLVAIPLLFVCETWLDPRLSEFHAEIVRSGLVRSADLPVLQALVARVTRWKDAWLPEAVCLLGSLALWWIAPLLQVPGTTVHDRSFAATDVLRSNWWYWVVCLAVLRFLLLRWLFRLCLWSAFLWRVSRLRLHLVSGHPDGAAGLGYLEVVHESFVALVLAISAALSASFATDIEARRTTLEGVLPGILAMLLMDVALFVGPLLVFSGKLWACRVDGLRDFTIFSQDYVSKFEAKWLGANAHPGEPLLGVADIQSLADLGNSFDRVRNMRIVAVGQRLLIQFAFAALLPLLPLLLFKYPLAKLASQVFETLAGM